MERLLSLMDETGVSAQEEPVDVYIIPQATADIERTLNLAEAVREALPELKVQMHCGGGSIKSQMKKADKSGAELAVLLSDDEPERVIIKYLREAKAQQLVDQAAVINFLDKNN